MEITDAFEAQNIQNAGTALTEEEMDEFRAWVKELYQRLSSEETRVLTPEVLLEITLDLAAHSFMAGGTYVVNNQDRRVPVLMEPEELTDYHAYLRERGRR